jgi:hypothetical protein
MATKLYYYKNQIVTNWYNLDNGLGEVVADRVEAGLVSGVGESDGDAFGADVEDGALVDQDVVGAVSGGDEVALLFHLGAVSRQEAEKSRLLKFCFYPKAGKYLLKGELSLQVPDLGALDDRDNPGAIGGGGGHAAGDASQKNQSLRKTGIWKIYE